MITTKFTLSLADYGIVGITLMISTCIGFYFRSVSKKTNDEYLLAGKNMSVFPVVISLMASFMSATTLMGIPAEMYMFGTPMAFMNVGFVLGPIITAYVFLPLYFNNNISTVYEYLEKRFGKRIRILISAAFTIQMGLFTSATLYAPALALSAVTNVPVWISIVTIGIVCTFYCTLGGMKAVIWTDVFQGLLMYVCLLTIIVKGSIDMGGIQNVFSIAYDGGRILLPKFFVNMEEQYTMFNVVFQGAIFTTSFYCGSQIQVQRLRTLNSLDRSKSVAVWSSPCCVIFHVLCCLSGLVFYAYFKDCDPLTAPNKPIHSTDQLMPYYILSAMRDYPGLPGLCIAGIFSASLSTVSSALNSLAAVTIEDFIKPLWPNATKNVFLTKLSCFLYGGICIAFSFLLVSLGNLVRMTVIIYGMVAGPNLGVFLLGALTKAANEEGTILGVVSGLGVAAFLSFYPSSTVRPFLPVSNNCTELNSSITTTTVSPVSSTFYNVINTKDDFNSTVEIPTEKSFAIPISYMWISSIALLTCIVVGYLGSLVAAIFKKKTHKVQDIYISPVRLWFSKKKSKDHQENKEKPLELYTCFQLSNNWEPKT